MYIGAAERLKFRMTLAHPDAEDQVEHSNLMMGLGDYAPYKIGGPLSVSKKLTKLSGVATFPGIGQVPVVVVKGDDDTFLGRVKGLMPFAVAMFGVSVLSSLVIHFLTRRPNNVPRDR